MKICGFTEVLNEKNETFAGYIHLTADKPVIFDAQHLLKAHLVQPSRIKLQHNYIGAFRLYDIRVTVANEINTVSTSFRMDVRQIINGTTFVCPTICKFYKFL